MGQKVVGASTLQSPIVAATFYINHTTGVARAAEVEAALGVRIFCTLEHIFCTSANNCIVNSSGIANTRQG
jgi:hypothetical protein